MDPINDPGSPAQKPAIQTLEGKVLMGLSVAGALGAFLSTLLEQGVLGNGKAAAIVGGAVALISAITLAVTRTILKMNGNKAAALVAAAKASASPSSSANPPPASP